MEHPSDEAPAPQIACSAPELTDAQLAESKKYGRSKLRCTLADMLIDLVYLSVMVFVFAVAIDRWLEEFAWLQNRWSRLAVYFLVLTGLHLVFSFPLSIYAGFVLEHKYQLSRQSLLRWLGRYLLQNLLLAAFSLALLEGLFAIIHWVGPWWWIVAAGALFVVNVLMGQLVPVLILPLFYKVERLDDEELMQRFDRLAEGTGLAIEGVYRMQLSRETVKANAMLAGLGRTRRVILGDTLLDGFSPDEIEVVLAHEIGHHIYRHIVKFLLAGLIVSFLAFFFCDLSMKFFVTRVDGVLDYAALPVYTLPLFMLTITLLSLVVGPFQNALSRRFERQCDLYALRRTGFHSAFLTAFRKLAVINKADPDPHPLEVLLFHDHPAISQRLALAQPSSGPATGKDVAKL